jgi:hypothetical protein
MLARAKGAEYKPLRSLEEARGVDDAYLVMEGDWGGQIYLVCPVSLVNCDEKALDQLLSELDEIAWDCNEGEGAGMYYERRKPGEGVAGGMGGGVATGDLWIHPGLVSKGLENRIRNVITNAGSGQHVKM